jgi:aldose 1-epimerase
MLEVRAGNARAGISAEAGGRLASLVVGGRELLVAEAGREGQPLGWGCYLMAPWAGRLANGRFDWRDRTIQLPRTFGRNAIHGLVWNRAWRVEERHEAGATLACALPAAWPMGGTVRQAFELTTGALVMTASVTAGDPMPAVIGWHPWFARRDMPMTVRVNAADVLQTRRMIPTGAAVRATGRLDLGRGPPLGRRRLDHAYVDAISPARLAWPDLRLTLQFEPSPASVVVHTPAVGVCVEPQTAPPNALALPEPAARAAGVRFLDAGETLTARFEIAWG